MLNCGTDLRLRAVPGTLRFTQGPMAMGFGLDEALGRRGVVRNDLRLFTVGGIAPDPSLLPMQQLRQHLAVMHSRRRRGDRMNQFRLTVDADMRLHAEVPRLAFLRLMHLRIPLLRPILARTGRRNNGRVYNGLSTDRNPCAARYAPIRAKSCSPNRWASNRCRNLQIVASSGTGSRPRSIPTNCRKARESYKASSTARSDRLNHCCRKWRAACARRPPAATPAPRP